ncbi:hypothetical protein [Noviherbaspirillum malthae]|uniref:hypothetical protein n=1 Tax=Noviherbaspirillum malthae TaxID=1260987 RepID=UPI0018902066|nr:hypothetical protein [Noviherbaspirillum malthae]
MQKFEGSMSRLFSSLGADDSSFRKATAAAPHDAEQRWPLLKELNPTHPQPAPVLSTLDKQMRSNAQAPADIERKPRLTVPGLGHKLAEGLRVMSPPGAYQAAGLLPPQEAGRDALRVPPQESEPKSRTHGKLFSNTQHVTVANPAAEASSGTPPAGVPRQETAASAVTEARPLASLFARLEGRPPQEPAAASARPSFLGRQGRR